MLEAASKQDRAPDTVYSLPFPVIIAPEALTPPNPAEVQVELAEVTEVTEVEEGAEPAKKKAVVPPVYKWHAVVPLVKSEQQEPPEQAAPAAAASEVRGLQLDQGPPRTAMPGTAAPAAGGAGPNPSTLTPGIFEGGLGELAHRAERPPGDGRDEARPGGRERARDSVAGRGGRATRRCRRAGASRVQAGRSCFRHTPPPAAAAAAAARRHAAATACRRGDRPPCR